LPHGRLALSFCLALIIGCGNKDSAQKPVARIDDRTLTLEHVRARLDSSRGVTSAQVGEFARRWINDEILYGEAVRRGMDNKESVRAQLEEVRRQLTINALLQDEIYTEKSAQSTPDEISQYYSAHNKEFTLPTDVALVSFLLFRDRDAANAFRTLVLKGTPWEQAVRSSTVVADGREDGFGILLSAHASPGRALEGCLRIDQAGTLVSSSYKRGLLHSHCLEAWSPGTSCRSGLCRARDPKSADDRASPPRSRQSD
jgi:hypothetical protein